MMSDSHSDALIFFGATGDLAHKKIFPSLQAMLKRGHLEVPVIRVAKSGWNLDQFRARARDSLEKHGGLLHCHSAGVVEQLGKSGCAEGARVIVSRWGPTSLQRGSSTESCSAHSTRRRLSASIITSGSGRCIT
jgi:hypothetical protein